MSHSYSCPHDCNMCNTNKVDSTFHVNAWLKGFCLLCCKERNSQQILCVDCINIWNKISYDNRLSIMKELRDKHGFV